MDKYITLRGAWMPQYSSAKGIINFPKSWYVRRVGWRGLWSFRKFMPWLSGDVLQLDLIIESNNTSNTWAEFTWVLIRRLPDMKEEQVKQEFTVITIKGRGKTRIRLDTYLFQYEDEYRLFTQLHPTGQTEPHRQTLLNFKVLARDVWYTDWEKALGIGMVGALLGFIAGIILTRLN